MKFGGLSDYGVLTVTLIQIKVRNAGPASAGFSGYFPSKGIGPGGLRTRGRLAVKNLPCDSRYE
jgi:hypothetical protein